MNRIYEPDPAMVEAARELWLRYEGRQLRRIEEEMRAAGWCFDVRHLFSIRRRRGIRQGWIERFGWTNLLSEKARRGLQPRRAGRHQFEMWLQSEKPEWEWQYKYQRYVYKHLDDLTKGRSRRLMVFMPPRHGKSEMVTVRYTAWRLLRDPKLNVILGSYSQKLANKFSRSIKRIVFSGGVEEKGSRGEKSSPGDRQSPPLLYSSSPPLLRSSAEWETPSGGVVRSVGVGGGIAGFGAGLIVIDDPVKNRAEAESEAFRDRVWEWFNDDIYTRMEPNASIILIQTRWHEDDLAGRLLKEMADGGEHWDVVSLAALAEQVEEKGSRGEKKIKKQPRSVPLLPHSSTPTLLTDPLGRKPGHALCPSRFPAKTLLRYKKKLGSYSFSALYQQRPAPAEGGKFKRAWFRKIIDTAPESLSWKRGYDLAISTKQTADYTASFRCAKDKQGNLYIADGYRARIEYPDQRRFILERMRTEKSTEHGIEAALHGRAFVQDLRREIGTSRFAFRAVRVDADKLTRALGPWIDDFLDEIARFPTGRHDDQIDAVSLAVNMLERRAGKFVTC